MKKRRGWLVLGVIAGLLAGGVWYWFHNQMRYEVVEIPLPAGFDNPFTLQLNDSGTVAGMMTHTADGSQHVFYWDRDGGFRDLDNLGIDGEDISISDMNNTGQIVGTYMVSEPLTEEAVQSGVKPRRDLHSFFYDPQQGLREILAPPGQIKPWAMAINNHGQVAAVALEYSDGNGIHRMILWTPEGGAEDLKAPGFPRDINDAGHIVGESFQPSDGFFWSRETGLLNISGPLKGNQVWMKINNSDQVVGLYGPDYHKYRPFRWDPKLGFRNIGRPYDGNLSRILDITDITDDGGYCLWIGRHWKLPWGLGEGQDNQSIVSIPGRFKTNLNRTFRKPNFIFTAADMNNNGWIVGVARDNRQSSQLLILIPTNYPKPK